MPLHVSLVQVGVTIVSSPFKTIYVKKMVRTTSYFADITDELVFNISLWELFLSNAGQMVDTMAGVTGDNISTTVALKAIPVMTILFYL